MIKRRKLTWETLDQRLMLSADLIVSATDLVDNGAYEVRLSNEGEAAFGVQFTQDGMPLNRRLVVGVFMIVVVR